MSESEGIREPMPIRPAGVVYAPDTFRGKVDQAVKKVKEGYRRYFQGADPIVKTKQEEESPR